MQNNKKSINFNSRQLSPIASYQIHTTPRNNISSTYANEHWSLYNNKNKEIISVSMRANDPIVNTLMLVFVGVLVYKLLLNTFSNPLFLRSCMIARLTGTFHSDFDKYTDLLTIYFK